MSSVHAYEASNRQYLNVFQYTLESTCFLITWGCTCCEKGSPTRKCILSYALNLPKFRHSYAALSCVTDTGRTHHNVSTVV
jgi:hypothetical protein